MKIVNVPGAGPLSFPDAESDESIYATIAKIQARLQQIDLETRPDPRDIPIGRQFSNSLNRGLGGLGATKDELFGLGAAGLGFDEAANRYLEEGKAKRQALEERYPTSYTALDKIRGPSDFAGFVAESIGENVPNIGLMALTGGAGSLAARGAAKYGVEAAAARAAAQRGLAGEAAETYATRLGNRLAPTARANAGETGFNVGVGAGSFGLNAPETFAGIHEETGKLEPGLAVGIGGLKALLDGILPARLMSQLGLRGQAKVAEELAARSSIVPDSFKLRLAKEVGKTAATEGATEGVQEALDIIAEQVAGAPGGLSDPKNVDRMLLAAAKGAAGGVGIGAPGALVQTMRETPAKQPEYSLDETKQAGSVGPGPAENVAAARAKLKTGEGITEDEFNLLVENKILNPESRASVKFAVPRTDAALETQTNAATLQDAAKTDQIQAAQTQAALQQRQQQNEEVRQAALAQAQEAAKQRQAREVAEFQAKQRAASEAAIAQRAAEAEDRTAALQERANVQPNAAPTQNVPAAVGTGDAVPSGPRAGVPTGKPSAPAPAGVATAEQPTQQAGVGKGTQPNSVELDSPENEWNNQFRFYSSEPKWEDLDPEYKFLWEDAHKHKRLTTSLFDQLVDLQTPGIVRRSQDYLGRPYTHYAAKEAGLPADRAAIVKAKKTDRLINGYFTMPRVVDNLTNLAHDIIFGSRSVARPKLGEKVEDIDLTKKESDKVAGHYNRTSAASLKKLDEWVRANLTEGAVQEYDRQLDIQRKDLARLQLGKLTTKAKEATAKAEKDAKEKADNEAEAERQRAGWVGRNTGPAPVTIVDPKAAQRQLNNIRALNEARIKRAAERAKTPEELAEQRAKEAEGQKTPFEIEQEKANAEAKRKDTELSSEAQRARARAAEQAAENKRLMEQREKELAAAAAVRAAAQASAPQPAETPAITKPEKPKEEVKKEEAPAEPSGNLPEGKPPLNTIVFSKDPENGYMYTPEAVKNYGDMVVSVTGTGPSVSFTPPIEIDNYSVTGAYINTERLGVSLITADGDDVRLTLTDGGNLLELERFNTGTFARLYRDKPDPKIESKFRRAFGDGVIDEFFKGTDPAKFLAKLTGIDVEPRFREISAAFEKQYLVEWKAQYAEGVAYKPLSGDFPISREDFARALGVQQHSSGWLSTKYNQALADAVTKGDANAVIEALSRSTNPIIRDIANRSRALQRFYTDRVKVAVDDSVLRQEEMDRNYPPNSVGGLFNPANRTIYISSTHAGSEVTAAHELIHALADGVLRNPISAKQREAAARLRALHKSVLGKAYSVYKTNDIKQLPYGLQDVHEFLAEGLANPEFQYLLAAIPHETNTASLWTRFVQAIADLLGFTKPNALTEVLDIYGALVAEGPSTAPVEQSVRNLASMGIPIDDPATPLADDLPKNAQVPPTVSTPVASTPQRAVKNAVVDPMQEYLNAAKNSELYINATDAVGRSALSVQPMWYIADTARKMGFRQIGEIENSLRKAGAMKNTMLKRSSDFMTKALELAKSDPAGKKAMDAFVNRASGLGIDVTRSKDPSPEFAKTRPDSVADYISLRAEYDKLQPKFQKLASDLVNQYRQFRDEYFAALKKSVEDQYQDDPVKADKILSGLEEKYKKFNEAYTPFVRIGDYWITYVNPNNGKEVAESYTSLGAQKTRLGDLKKEGIVHVQSFKQTDFRKFSYKSGPVNQFFDEIKGNVNKALPIHKDDSTAVADRIREAREEMKERLYQASLLLHPEASMLRQFGLERKGTLGYIEDTLAAFDHKAPIYATQISQVAHKGQIEHQIESARKQNASNPDTKMSDIITHVAKVVYGVDTIRADDPMNRIANNVNRLGFTFYMGFNPASAVVNLLQTPTVMFPLLAGEFHGLGQSKIMSTLFSAMTKIISGSVGQQTYGERLVESAETKIDAAVAKGKTREEAIAALPEMERVFLSFRDQGVLNAGDPSHDFGSVAKYGSGETSAFGKGVQAFTKYSAIMFQRAEAINREAGALATYQLMKQRLSGKADMTNQDKYDQAIRKATDMVTRAHGDYQHGLAPKIFLSPTMRVILMFKKFPAHMAALYVRLFKDMFSSLDPEVRKVARIQFTGLMGMSGLFAGTMGMPFYFIVRDMMNLMLDDKDDPYDFDFAFYNYLSDMWGQPMANRITRGWLGDLGGDVTSKVGYASSPLLGGTKQLPFIGGLLGLRDGKNTASAEDDLKNYVAEAAGASAGMALQIARGVDKLAQGDVYRFLEGVIPMAGMRNIAKSIRLTNEGALTTRGEPMIEDVSLIETALQGVGFTPQRLAGQYQLNAWQKDTEKQILDRRQSLINQKFNARARQNYDTESDVNDEIRRFNTMNPEKGLKITPETLAASARTRAKQEKDTKAGIYLSKPFRQRFADVPVYAET